MTTSPEQNKALVLKAFDMLFNKRDYVTAERFWSAHYIQHSAHIPPGRAGLFDRHELARDAAGTRTMLRRRPALSSFSRDGSALSACRRRGSSPTSCAWRMGVLAEHWDVIQDDATREQSRSGLPMFGDRFPVAGIDAISRRRSHSVIFTNPCWTSWVVLAMASVLTLMPGKRSALPQW